MVKMYNVGAVCPECGRAVGEQGIDYDDLAMQQPVEIVFNNREHNYPWEVRVSLSNSVLAGYMIDAFAHVEAAKAFCRQYELNCSGVARPGDASRRGGACLFDHCERPAYSQGLCRDHYFAHKRAKKPMPLERM